MSGTLGAVIAIGALLYWIVQASLDLGVPTAFVQWFRQPGNSVRFHTWLLSLVGVTATLFGTTGSLLADFRTDAISIAITVIVLEEFGRYRAYLERKQEIFEQVQSCVRDFAVEALRIAIVNNWLNELIQQEKLVSALFEGADLSGIVLDGADLSAADLRGANFIGTKLRNADLSAANLRGANLSRANLQGANLTGANLSDANLQGADLSGANLTAATLDRADLEGLRCDDRTIWAFKHHFLIDKIEGVR